jgi:hypothetical protein
VGWAPYTASRRLGVLPASPISHQPHVPLTRKSVPSRARGSTAQSVITPRDPQTDLLLRNADRPAMPAHLSDLRQPETILRTLESNCQLLISGVAWEAGTRDQPPSGQRPGVIQGSQSHVPHRRRHHRHHRRGAHAAPLLPLAARTHSPAAHRDTVPHQQPGPRSGRPHCAAPVRERRLPCPRQLRLTAPPPQRLTAPPPEPCHLSQPPASGTCSCWTGTRPPPGSSPAWSLSYQYVVRPITCWHRWWLRPADLPPGKGKKKTS